MGHFLYLCLVFCFMTHVISAIDITDLFTLQKGTSFGGCDNQLASIDQYLEEAIYSIDATNLALSKYADRTEDGARIRQAVLTWFGPTTVNELKSIIKNIKFIGDFVNGLVPNQIPREDTFLFCDSTWLVTRQADDPVQDYMGNNILLNGRPVTISEAYKAATRNGDTPWFSGDHTPFNGYYFTGLNGGGNYCMSNTNLGFTSNLRTLRQAKKSGKAAPYPWLNNYVILCPSSFTTANPDSYELGSSAITAGMPLDRFIPKSATFLHELFHVGFGTNFNEGTAESYGLARCIELAMINRVMARKNPENYIFFISSMYYLFGETSGDQGSNPAITVYWDFTNGPDHAQGPIPR